MDCISIVGRPNVGKSALFNRIAGRRIAIVFDQPGVTRDRVAREIRLRGRSLLLVDTGGLAFGSTPGAEDPLAMQTKEQAKVAIADSRLCIIVADAIAGVTPLDEEVIRMVRTSGVRCVIAANKCDRVEDAEKALEFERFGVKVFAVSAEHNIGIDELVSEIVDGIPKESATDVKPLRVAVVGRPNAGKSSYINKLLNEERVIVSDIAGTTRDAVDVPFSIGEGEDARHYVLVDTAGMKSRNKMSKTSVDYFSLFRGEKAIEEADVVVMVMEAETGPTRQDMRIAGKILEAKKACLVIMNKWDVASDMGIDQKEAEEAVRKMLPFFNFAPVVFASAKTGYNVRRTLDAIDAAAESVLAKLPTGVLNRTLVEATKRTLAPMRNGRRLKVYYGLQTGTNPVAVRLFVNDPGLVTPEYLRYLEKNIRARFGLVGAPLAINLKARSRKDGAVVGIEAERLKRQTQGKTRQGQARA
ncbi:MAG: ribosome biogenesis GTPase Der [Kiritimatiellae bacterium]|nr:ribosome biogenesis GTPase Der [Kiritimatiellia bacterium]